MNEEFPAYAPSEEHELLRATVRELAEAKIAPAAADVDENSRFPQEALDALTGAGLHAVHIPQAYGGEGADALATVTEILEGGGPPLGVMDTWRYEERSARLTPGMTALLYTDGLVERRDESLDVSLEALRQVVASAGPSLDAMCDRVLDALSPLDEGDWPDDVALLAVHRD